MWIGIYLLGLRCRDHFIYLFERPASRSTKASGLMLSGFLRCWSEFLTSCWPKRRNTIDWWWFLMERHSNPSEEAIPINSTSPWCVSVTTWSHSGYNLGEGGIASPSKSLGFPWNRIMPTTQLLLAAAWGDPRWGTHQWDIASAAVPVRNLHAAFDYFFYTSTMDRYCWAIYCTSRMGPLPFICAGVEMEFARISSEDKWVSVYICCTLNFHHLQLAMKHL